MTLPVPAVASGPVPSGRRALLVWLLGVLAYGVAVFHRGSLGVAGLAAQHRFGASAAELGLFSMLQLAVYAGMQVPAGVLLDRYGSRRMLTAGALVMAAGQAVLATTDTVPGAVVARVLVGVGDALTFISVLRLVTVWFPPRRAPVFTQLTGILGQLGQVAATFPLVALLHDAGWTRTFLSVAAAGLVVGLLALAGVRDVPAGTVVLPPAGLPEVRSRLADAWREPGTRLGLWTHFSTQFSGTVFGLLWGYPFLVVGQGLSPHAAGLLLSLLVLAGIGIGPSLGALAGRWPFRRSVLVRGIVLASASAWAVVLLWPGRAPLWLLVVLVLVLASNGPGSMLGFDYARTDNPADRLGSASGIVNVGGFVASLTTVLSIGVVLDLLAPAGGYGLGDLKVAFALQYLLWAVGLQRVAHHRRALRRVRLAQRGVLVDPLHQAVRRRLRSR
ncbi:MAG: Transporter, superfamily [Frankiales bacterium]|nr:Transporter, superfamily [Frankiales bacterium]